jgi:hypothetical protein
MAVFRLFWNLRILILRSDLKSPLAVRVSSIGLAME